MHFYEFNIGEYAKKTQHLTNEEDIAYRRALDMYYDTEKPLLTDGLATLSRRLRVDEQALKNVLEEFFPNGVNKHAEEKIVEYYAYIAKQQANGKLGGRPKRAIQKPTANPPLTQGKPTAKPPLTTNHLPVLNTLVASDAGRLSCPHEQIISLYHEILPTLPSVKIWNDKRKQYLQTRWREDENRQSLDFWKRFFEYVSKSDFLCGRSGTFQATLEWLVNSSNFVKVVEGNYENRKAV